MDLTVVPYNNHTPKSENQNDDVKKNHNNNNNNNNNDVADREPVVTNPSNMTINNTVITVNYKECMRNHAASLGGHANDDCGEFMPRGTNNKTTTLLLKISSMRTRSRAPHVAVTAIFTGGKYSTVSRRITIPCTCTLRHQCLRCATWTSSSPSPSVSSTSHGGDHHDRGRSETPERVVGPVTITRSRSINNTTSAKRFRTKFTQEQKEKMLEFAEKIGWRIQRHDDVALHQFCSGIGVKHNVLKVWMHNNKNAHRRRESGPDDSPSEPPPQQQQEEQPIGS